MSPRFKTCLALALLFIFAACSTVAVTGRKQLLLISGDEINALASDQYKEVISKSKLSSDAPKTEMVKRVGVKIQKAVESYMASTGNAKELNGFKWEYNLIEDDKTVNAWCMPGGKVAFYTAILPICLDEMGVAVVMGHEVAHAIANHGAERMSEQLVAQVGMEAVGTAVGKDPAMSKQILLQAVGAGTSLGLLKFSRKHESEADHMGLIFMAMAGYDPRQAPEFWKRMATIKGGAAPPEFLSTHPSDERRIADINKKMPEALKYYKQP